MKQVSPTRRRKCQQCKTGFTPERPFQRVCSIPCAIAKAHKSQDKAYRAETRRRKQAAMTLSDHHKVTQRVFNRFIRLRDMAAGYPCISCQRHHTGQYHAGHYLSVGANPELRYCEDNNHLQCSPCNNHLSGNQAQYRLGLIERIGQDRVDWLEGPHEHKRYRIADLQELQACYKEKIKGFS